MIPTLSGLSLIAACPGSASLPRQAHTGVYRQGLGHAIHQLIEDCIAELERCPEAIALMRDLAPDDAGRLAFLAEHLHLDVPAGALAEVSLGYFPDGSVRRIEGGAGNYPDVGQILSGQLDCMWAEPLPLFHWSPTEAQPWIDGECPPGSTLFLTDWKTGTEDNVPPPDRNWQLRAGALLAARWTGATRVIVAVCYVNAAECAVAVRDGRPYGGRWEVGAPLDAAALDAIEVELRAVLRTARGESCDVSDRGYSSGRRGGDGSARGDVAAWKMVVRVAADPSGADQHHHERHPAAQGGNRSVAPALILGPHCEHCPARRTCPALAAEAVSLATGAGLYLPPGRALTSEAASYLGSMLPALQRMVDAAEVGLKAHVRAHGPVRLPDGRDYGPHSETVTTYETGATFDALAEVVGEEAARGAFRTSGEALEECLRESGAPRGAWGRLKADVEKRGGMVVTAREVFRRKWPAVPAEAASDGEVEMGTKEDARAAASTVREGENDGTDVASVLPLPPADGGAAEVPAAGEVARHVPEAMTPAPKTPRANPLSPSWMPSDDTRRMLRERSPPVYMENLMPAYRAAMAGQTAGRWTDARFLRWVDAMTDREARA